MMPIAAEGVTVRQMEMSCTRDDKGTNSTKLNKEQIWYILISVHPESIRSALLVYHGSTFN